ncbi:disease resistance protein RGA2-like isoform X3 [Miscanthus floridulus]|uniref:disease resistance protein RGA2-like isoform X3 n=1 Tax=Miscanthus floridulus TaxID=154761 RepID=UPI003457FE7A
MPIALSWKLGKLLWDFCVLQEGRRLEDAQIVVQLPIAVHHRCREKRNTFHKPVTMNLPQAMGAITGLNECATLIQWVKSAFSFLRSKWSNREEQKLAAEVLCLVSSLQGLREATLPAMYDLVDRAEWRSHVSNVAEHLPALKDAVYDAEDLLDEFKWYELKMQVENNATQPPSVEFFNSVVQGSFSRVDDIQKRLDTLSSELEKTGLRAVPQRFDESIRPKTSSFPTEKRIFGRDKELKDLISLLCVPMNGGVVCPKRRRIMENLTIASTSNQATVPGGNGPVMTSVSVLPMVGIGGIGKTTLAQQISKHPEVNSHFKKIGWVCVSDEFDVKRLTQDAIQSVSRKQATTDDLDSLQQALVRQLNKERFLIILDDMWDDALNGQCWERFCAPLTNVVQGSMLLVTTRSQKVADRVGTMESFPLGSLNNEDFWDFFKQCAFGSDASHIDPELEQIGRGILGKLKGSPLAAKTLGRLLGMKLDTRHWSGILESELWQLRQEETDILPALRLSYVYLPFYLKRCFSFCAVYPKDYNFEKESLAELWVAEGFVVPEGNIPLQEIGSRYFEDLVNRSFFQILGSKYVIHDLIHDMAQLVSKEDCFIINNTSDIQNVPQNVRHLSILQNSDVDGNDLLRLSKHRKLRTLFCNKSLSILFYGKSLRIDNSAVLEHWFSELGRLRVIIFASIRALPKNMSNMKHLRYLEISKNCVSKSLPSVFCCLYNIQILYARRCKFDNFPGGSTKLINLQRFESATYQFCQEHALPIHASATAGQGNQLRLRDYQGASLPNSINPENFANITLLSIHNCNGLKSISVSRNSQQTNLNVKPAVLFNNMVVGDSIGTSTFSYLVELTIEKCQDLSSLEHFLSPDYIPAIKKIVIADCQNMESVPTGSFGDFRFLEELNFWNCPKIKSKRLRAPSLKMIKLKNSGNVGGYIDCGSLTILHLTGCPLAAMELRNWGLPSLQELKISNCAFQTFTRSARFCPFHWLSFEEYCCTFPSLSDITIENCQNLSSLEQFLEPAYIPAIKKIVIGDCRNVEFVPTERFGDLHFLEVLEVLCCPKIRSQRLFSRSLKQLKLVDSGNLRDDIDCGSITSFDLFRTHQVSIDLQKWSLPLLQQLNIRDCASLTTIIGGSVAKFPLLTQLTIESCNKVEALDDILLSLHAIECINISQCGSLSTLPAEQFGSFPLLKDLSIWACPNLDWKNGMVLPSSLQRLSLDDCGDLSASFPGFLENLTSLELLDMSYCKGIVSIPARLWGNNLVSLQELLILGCQDLEKIGQEAIANIKKVYIVNCPKLMEVNQPLIRGDINQRSFAFQLSRRRQFMRRAGLVQW